MSWKQKDHSMMTFENSPHQGTAAIVEKLTSLAFSKVKHQVATQDAQPSGEHGGILVLITGALLVCVRITKTDALDMLTSGDRSMKSSGP